MKLQKLKPSHLTLILILINTTKMYNLPPQGKEKKKNNINYEKNKLPQQKKLLYIYPSLFNIASLVI